MPLMTRHKNKVLVFSLNESANTLVFAKIFLLPKTIGKNQTFGKII